MIYRFGAFELDEQAGELRRAGEPVSIQPKPLELLVFLIRARERVVSADELFDSLWSGVAVTPGSLTRAVSHARRAIGDTHKGTLLRSYPRRGYRFCGEVVEIDPSGAERAQAAPAPARSPGTPGPGFVGRADALGVLREAWSAASERRGSVVVVSGTAGIGKTRLCEVFLEETAQRGPMTVVGRCRGGEGVPAFWVWAQVLRQLIDEPSLGDEVRELVGHSSELAGLVPELGPSGPRGERGELSPAQSRFLFFDAVARVLVRCSRRRPLVVALEDLQWAGPSSLQLLEHVATEISHERVLIVANVRDEARERSHPVERTLALLRQLDRCAFLALRHLSRAEVGQLLEQSIGRRPPPDLTSEIFAYSEGLPLFVREAIRLMSERGELLDLDLLARRGVRLPGHSVDLIDRALGSLSAECARLIGAAGVLGREFGLPLAAAVAELPRERALDLLDEATEAGVVEPVRDAVATYRFTHALFHEAANASLSAGARVRLHQRAAERLEQQVGDDLDRVIAEVAHHRHVGLAVGDPERAYECALRAANRAAMLFAYEQMATHYEQAIDALDHFESVDPALRLGTLLLLGEAYRLAGVRARRREVLMAAMESARALDRPADFARAAIGFCDLSEWAVHDEPAYDAVQEALARLGESCPVERTRLTTRLAYLASRDRARAEARGREAVALARQAGDADALQEAMYTLHLILAGPDDLDERDALAHELVDTVAAAHQRDPALIAAIDVACDRIALGDRKGALEMRSAATDVAGEAPHPGLVWHMNVYDTGWAILEGRFEEAERMAQDAYLIGQRIEHPYALGCFNAHVAGIARERGDHAEVLRIMSPGMDGRGGLVRWVSAFNGQSLWALGREGEARRVFDRLAANGFADVARGIRWTATMVELANFCADVGDAERAALLCDQLDRIEHHHGVLPVPICYGGPVSRCLARLREVMGRSDEADELYAEALDASLALGAQPVHARVALEYAGLCVRRGRKDRAVELARESARLADALGLAEVGRRAGELLAEVGAER